MYNYYILYNNCLIMNLLKNNLIDLQNNCFHYIEDYLSFNSKLHDLIIKIGVLFNLVIDFRTHPNSLDISYISNYKFISLVSCSFNNDPTFKNIDKNIVKKIFYHSLFYEDALTPSLTLNQKIETIKDKIKKNLIEQLYETSNSLEKNINFRNANFEIKNYLISEIIDSKNLSSAGEIFKNSLVSHNSWSEGIRFLSRIHANNRNHPNWIRSFLQEASNRIMDVYNEQDLNKNPSLASRDALRAPTEVLIDLLSYLNDLNSEKYISTIAKIKKILLNHQASITKTKKILEDMQIIFKKDQRVVKKLKSLLDQLMKKPLLTQLNDNIYGRVFDSLFVSKLIENPPKEVLNLMTKISQGFANYLESIQQKENFCKNFSKEIKTLLKIKEPRFWFPATQLEQIKNEEKTLELLIDYLKKPKQTGYEAISICYLIVKISLILKKSFNKIPPWLEKADLIYEKYLHPEVKGIRINNFAQENKDYGTGITLSYQPEIGKKSWMISCQRPAIVRKPRLSKYNQTLHKQLAHGIPWVSGMSGSTNILLYAFNYFNKKYKLEIGLNINLLPIIMFLVHDGGHSIHEPLWAASKIGSFFDKNFTLDDQSSDDNHVFISKKEKFLNLYSDHLKNNIHDAFEKSFKGVIDYYKKYSFYYNK